MQRKMTSCKKVTLKKLDCFLSAFLALVLFTNIGATFFVGDVQASEVSQAEEKSLVYWADRLRNGSVLERRHAALKISSKSSEFTQNDTTVVPALISALEQRQDYLLQTYAAAALMRIGPPAHAAIPALVQALKAPDQEDDSIRQQAAGALSVIAKDVPEPLIAAFESEKNEAVIVGLLRVFRQMKSKDPRVFERIRLILIERGEETDLLKDEAIMALKFIGDYTGHTIEPWLLKTLSSAENWGLKKALVEVLGYLQISRDKKPASNEVISALLRAAQDSHNDVAWKAFEAIERSNVASPAVRQVLIQTIGNPSTDTLVIATAVKAASTLFPHDERLAAAVASWLERRDQVAASNMDEALVHFGRLATGPIIEIMRSSKSSEAKIAGAAILARIGIGTQTVITTLQTQLRSPTDEERSAAADALVELGLPGLETFPDLVQAARAHPGEERLHFLEALGSLASIALAHPDDSRPIVRRWRQELANALAIAKQEAGGDEFNDKVMAPLERLSSSAERDDQYRTAIIAVALLAPILALLIFIAASWRARRYILFLLGRRWYFSVNACDAVVRILTINNLRRVLVSRDQAGSAISDFSITYDTWPPNAEALAPIQQQIGLDERIRLEIDLESFSQPWSSALAGGWAGKQKNVAGQICLAPPANQTDHSGVRRIVFTALHCGQDDGQNGQLPFAQAEALALAAVFSKWGAISHVDEQSATSQDFLKAFCSSDVIHIASHATFEQLLFSDRSITATDLNPDVFAASRCKFLVLSACDAADIERPSALLWSFVRAGVNVIAAQHRVPDHICRAFFEEMYSAMLPTRHAHGIELAAAIRHAIGETRKRFAVLDDKLPNQHDESVDAAVNSFVLFGDPTLHLKIGGKRG
jgi:hypothetical protein